MKRAETKLNTYDEATNTIEFVFATAAPVKRYGRDGNYMEVLSMEPSAIRMQRFLSGAPVLSNHYDWSLDDQIGAVTSARLENGQLVGSIKFSSREELATLRKDVAEGIYRNGSVGYKVHSYTDITAADGVRTLLATDWEPCEFSIVSIPADPNAQARADEDSEAGVPVINDLTSRAAVTTKEGNLPNEDHKHAELTQTAVAAERTRAAEINDLATRAAMPADWAAQAISSGLSVDVARSQAMDLLLKKQASTAVSGQHIETRENGDLLKAAEDALFAQVNNTAPTLDQARSMMKCSPLEIAGVLADARGIKTDKHGRDGMLARALHTTSDFPALFQNVLSRTLAARMDAMPPWYDNTLVGSGTINDFRPSEQFSSSGFPSLLKMNEHAEYEGGTFTTAKQSVKLGMYGRRIGVTGELLRNDDLGIFDFVIGGMDVSLNRMKSKGVSQAYLSNPIIGETGFALFGTGVGSHNNQLAGATSAPSIASLTAAEKILMKTKTLDGDTMGLRGATIVCGTELFALFAGLLAPITSTTIADTNIYSGRFKVMLDPNIDDQPVTATFDPAKTWYMFTPRAASEVLKTFNLAGENGPVVEVQDSWDTWGMETRVRMAFSASAMTYRGAVKAVGF